MWTRYKRPLAPANTFLCVTFCRRRRYKRPPAPANTFLCVTFCRRRRYKRPPAPANTFLCVTFCRRRRYKRPGYTGEGEGVTHLRSLFPSGSLMLWPTRPATWRHRNSVAKTAACGASKNCKHPPTSTRPESHLFHDKTTCNLTGASWPMDSRLPLPTAPALGGAGCASGVFMRAQACYGPTTAM